MKAPSHFNPLRQRLLPLAMMLVLGTVVGCGKSGDSDQNVNPPVGSPPTAVEAMLTACEQGDSSGAIKQFLETDWNARPLFSPGSAMSLSEDQFKALPATQREAESAEVQARLATLRKLAGAVAQAGREAAVRKDAALARKHFAAIGQFGSALDEPNSLLLVQLVGQALKKMAAAETVKLE